jgi:hypothetical protein
MRVILYNAAMCKTKNTTRNDFRKTLRRYFGAVERTLQAATEAQSVKQELDKLAVETKKAKVKGGFQDDSNSK